MFWSRCRSYLFAEASGRPYSLAEERYICRFSVRRRFAVVASQSLKKNDCEIWMMPDEDYVVTRFLFVCVCCRILVSSLLRRESLSDKRSRQRVLD